VERRRRLRDRLARPAAELFPHMLGHEPLPWNDIERLGVTAISNLTGT
jgi:hypothetical protein